MRDVPFPGVTVVWLLVPMRRVRCECGCRRTEVIPWIARHEQCTNRFIAAVQHRLREQDTSTSAVASEFNLGWDAVRRFDKEQLEALFTDVDIRNLRRIAIDEIAIHKGQRYPPGLCGCQRQNKAGGRVRFSDARGQRPR